MSARPCPLTIDGRYRALTEEILDRLRQSRRLTSRGDTVTLPTAADVDAQLPQAVIEDANGIIWLKRQRMYGSSWYQPGDRQAHGTRDIALPARVLRAGQPWDREESGE